MGAFQHIKAFLTGPFLRKEDGAILVEFALVLPLFILFIGISAEFGNVFWKYKTAIAGVRDASRYLARVAPIDICLNGGNLNGYSAQLMNIVDDDMLGTAVTIDTVTANLSCIAGAYRIPEVPVATVTATMTVNFPFASIIGASNMSVTDQARIYGQ